MLSQVFDGVFHMSLAAGGAILWVMLARLLLRRTPKFFSMTLWGVVLLRLLCPVSIPSPLPLLGVEPPPVHGTVTAAAAGTLPQLAQTAPAPVGFRAVPGMDLVALVWLAGAVVLAACGLIACLRLRYKLREAVPLEGNVYLSDRVDSPFVLGMLAPKIYLPAGLDGEERDYILRHEQSHIRHLDHITKPLAFLALCIHWFNPLVWAAFLLAGRDMEMSCDEAVVKELGPQIRADYSASLLRFATGRPTLAGTPLTFGEGEPGRRIRNLARWKKPTAATLALSGTMCLLLGCALVTESAQVDPAPEQSHQEIIDGLTGAEVDFLWPLPGYTEYSAPFGERINPITGKEIRHCGVDVPAPKGTPVLSMKGGTVTRSGYEQNHGNFVEVAHPDGSSACYCHLSAIRVEKGQAVVRGSTLGLVGSTGRATGSHLHLEIRVDGDFVDPCTLYPELAFTYGGSQAP